MLTLVSAESGRSFSDDDVELVGEIARRAGIAVENARLYAERTQIARTLQTSLLPEELPEIPGWETAALYRPAGDENWVGGDFYDAFETTGGLMFIVGDVTGRGAEAAALTGLMRHSLRTAATLTGSARDALVELNRKLCASRELSLCTAVCVVIRDGPGEAQADDLLRRPSAAAADARRRRASTSAASAPCSAPTPIATGSRPRSRCVRATC